MTAATTTTRGSCSTSGLTRRRQRHDLPDPHHRHRPGPGGPASNTDGEQSFALYALRHRRRRREIYGLGAMQMFTPLSSPAARRPSEFYLAQIDGVHAGKTVEIQLWDPGDTPAERRSTSSARPRQRLDRTP